MAVERVERRLRKVTAALDAEGIKYAVIGGNAVAAWVARVDPAATRATKDVDLLLDRDDEPAAERVMKALGFARRDIVGVTMFIDPDEPSARSSVHIVWAKERVRREYHEPAPSIDESVRDPQGFRVLDLPALVRMKLTSFRRIDQVHIEDMLRVELIDERARRALSEKLQMRLREIESTMEE